LSIQKPYSGRYNKNLKAPCLQSPVFVMLKHKI
jgi:hypothetical protein